PWRVGFATKKAVKSAQTIPRMATWRQRSIRRLTGLSQPEPATVLSASAPARMGGPRRGNPVGGDVLDTVDRPLTHPRPRRWMAMLSPGERDRRAAQRKAARTSPAAPTKMMGQTGRRGA